MPCLHPAFIVCLIAFFSSGLKAQSVAEAREQLQFFEEKSLSLFTKLCELHLEFFTSQKDKPEASSLPSFSRHIEHEIHQFEKTEAKTAKEHLKPGYIRLLNAFQHQSKFLRQVHENWKADSAWHHRNWLLDQEKKLLYDASGMEHEVSAFCILNRLNRPEDKSRLPVLIREEWKRLEYLLQIQRIMIPVIVLERNCLGGFIPDSATTADKRRLAFSNAVMEATTTLKGVPACCGDRDVKNTALNSLHQFAIEAKNELVHLEKFLDSEEEFILHHQRSKSDKNQTEAEKEAYRKSVRKYNEDIRLANELVRKLNHHRANHLAAFQAAQEDFLKNAITAFRE